jgi:hypothetical protein|tara:strand:+ start:1205 stop:1378 length:174 start_codon:yes stop_codon:yes gene_type:complete
MIYTDGDLHELEWPEISTEYPASYLAGYYEQRARFFLISLQEANRQIKNLTPTEITR